MSDKQIDSRTALDALRAYRWMSESTDISALSPQGAEAFQGVLDALFDAILHCDCPAFAEELGAINEQLHKDMTALSRRRGVLRSKDMSASLEKLNEAVAAMGAQMAESLGRSMRSWRPKKPNNVPKPRRKAQRPHKASRPKQQRRQRRVPNTRGRRR